MRSATFLLFFALCALAVVPVGCDLVDSDESDDGDDTSPSGPVLVATMGGDMPGVWTFNPDSLEPAPLVETQDRIPLGVAASPDNERWYSAWSTGSFQEGTGRNVLAAIDPVERRIVERRSRPADRAFTAPLLYEPVNDQIVVPDVRDTTQFFDVETLELVREQRIVGSNSDVVDAVVAEKREKMYVGAVTEGGDQIVAYDLAEREITTTIPVAGLPAGLSDIALSPDERYLFAMTWKDFSSPGTFYMVDLETGETVFEGGPVGKKANLAVHPNGRYVYVDCPAGGGLDALPTNRLTRFDVEARKLEVFLDSGEDLGLGSEGLVTDQITMLPGGEAFVVKDPVPSEHDPSLFAVDAETGAVRATYTPPHEEDGTVKNYVWRLDVATIPGQ
jgi:DNA-binding beta-propeller fold protein YncE